MEQAQPEIPAHITERATAMLAGSYARRISKDGKEGAEAFGLAFADASPGSRQFFVGMAQRMADSPEPLPWKPPVKKARKVETVEAVEE